MSVWQLDPVTISVIIPAHNAAAYIRETLDSVLGQTYPALEVVVIDDGSTDGTVDIVRSYVDKVKLYQQDNLGVACARNTGIRLAQGEYIAFIDADDLWKPNKLERQGEYILRKRVSWVCCGTEFFDNESGQRLPGYAPKLYEGDVLEKEFLESFILSPTPVIKKNIFDEAGLFFPARIAEDWDMWLRIAALYSLGTVRDVLALKREHPASVMGSASIEEKLSWQLATIDRAVNREPERLGPLKDRCLARVYLSHGETILKRGQLKQGREYILKSWHLNRLSPKAIAYRLIFLSGDRLTHKIMATRGQLRALRK